MTLRFLSFATFFSALASASGVSSATLSSMTFSIFDSWWLRGDLAAAGGRARGAVDSRLPLSAAVFAPVASALMPAASLFTGGPGRWCRSTSATHHWPAADAVREAGLAAAAVEVAAGGATLSLQRAHRRGELAAIGAEPVAGAAVSAGAGVGVVVQLADRVG